MLAMVQDVVDASYEGKKGHVDVLGIQLVEIGRGAFSQVVLVQVPKADNKIKIGDQVEVTINGFFGVFSNMVKVNGKIVPVK